MMDYYANFPGPNKTDAKNEVIEEIKKSMDINSINLLKKIVDKEVDKEISDYGGLGSFTGWNVIVRKRIINNCKDKYSNKIKKTKKKFKLYSKIIGKLQLRLNKSIERVYMPGGTYETETANSNRWTAASAEDNTQETSENVFEYFPKPTLGLCSPYGHSGPCKIIKRKSISPKNYSNYDSDEDYDYEYEYCNPIRENYRCVLCWKYECSKCHKRSNSLTSCPHCRK